MAKEAILTRQKLYELVWSKSMVQLAKEFNLSDVGLAKICKKYDIPRPGLGYWAKLEHGKPVTKSLLPNEARNEEIIIDTSGRYREMQNKHGYSAEKLRKLSECFTVPDTLKNPHPLIQKTQKIMSENTNSYYRALEVLDINVRKSYFSRALRIMDTFIKIMEDRRHTVEIQHDGPREYETIVNIKGERIEIKIYEKGGVLTFGLNWIIDGRKNWGDGKKVPLEKKLYDIVFRILHVAKEKLERSIYWRKRRRQEEREKQNHLAEEQKKQEELQRIHDLETEAANWRKSRLIREYLKATEEFVNTNRGGYEEGSEYDLWLKWAYGYADRIDPLKLEGS